MAKRPEFDELPVRDPFDPAFSAWGLYGSDDQLGTLNLLTPAIVRNAAAEIRHGESISLNLPLDVPLLPMNPARKPCSHNIICKGHANDDELYMNTQGSTHWDGLRHYPYQTLPPQYYNGAVQENIAGDNANDRIGIHNIARRTVVGRGVLLDWRSYAMRNGIQYSPFSSHPIPLQELEAVAREENVELRPGDILLVRSGWTEEYLRLSDDAKLALARRSERSFVGVEASRAVMEWLWDHQIAAVAGDTNAWERWPPVKSCGVSLHEVLLSGWGMPIGELWDLEALAARCREVGKWTFFLSSVPLNLSNGVASPANATAIL